METDSDVKELVELISGKKSLDEVAAHSSIPSDMLQILTPLLSYRLTFVVSRWQKNLARYCSKILNSHENYLSYLMFACIYENKCNENIYDSFISVYLLITYFSEDIFSKVSVDFRFLTIDIFMFFYRNEMNRIFRKRKYFHRLVEYIRNHNYIKWVNNSTASTPENRHYENIKRDYKNYRATENLVRDSVPAMRDKGARLALDVLSTTSVKLPDLPSESELKERLDDYRERVKANEAEKIETTLTMETSHGKESLNSYSNINFMEPQKDAAWHESIIEAVIRDNHSTDCGQEITNSQSHEKANDILKHLESKVKSLIEILDECGEK